MTTKNSSLKCQLNYIIEILSQKIFYLILKKKKKCMFKSKNMR